MKKTKTKTVMVKKSILTSLFLKDVCFAVGVDVTRFKLKSLDMSPNTYFIMVSQRDKIKVKGLRFKNSNKYEILVRDLSHDEVLEFKAMNDRFNKVVHTEDGRTYELKGKSFKKYHQSISRIDLINSLLKSLEVIPINGRVDMVTIHTVHEKEVGVPRKCETHIPIEYMPEKSANLFLESYETLVSELKERKIRLQKDFDKL